MKFSFIPLIIASLASLGHASPDYSQEQHCYDYHIDVPRMTCGKVFKRRCVLNDEELSQFLCDNIYDWNDLRSATREMTRSPRAYYWLIKCIEKAIKESSYYDKVQSDMLSNDDSVSASILRWSSRNRLLNSLLTSEGTSFEKIYYASNGDYYILHFGLYAHCSHWRTLHRAKVDKMHRSNEL
jgi:hypothetical protein